MPDWKREAIHLKLDEGKTWGELVERYAPRFPDLTQEQVRNKIRDAVRRSPEFRDTQAKPVEGKRVEEWNAAKGEYTSDRLIEICDQDEITPELILKAHGLDAGAWDVVSYRNNYWHSQVRGGSRMVMYQSRLTAKPADKLSFDEIARHFEALDRKYQLPTVRKTERRGRLMAEVNVADIHLGKLCWHGDTGANYDSKIAREVFYGIIAEVVDVLNPMAEQLDYITFVWTNDFFNSDTIAKTTTLGTPQDTDRRWQSLFNTGVEMLVAATGMLAEVAPVKMFYTASNHDEVSAYHAIKYLGAWFRNDPRVEVDADAKPRKYMLYGNTLLGFGHGDKEGGGGTRDKASRLASAMPIEAAHLWGQAKFREFHAAHLHSEQMIQEINGVIVRRISSPTAADTWHTSSGYIGAVRKAQSFLYDKERGLMQIINTPV